MRIRLEQLNPTIGDIEGNRELILKALKNAEAEKIDLLILPEMVTTGYPPLDLLESEHFRECCFASNETIISKTNKTAILFGTITPNENEFGRKLFNTAILAADGKEIGSVNKTLLPTYDIFDDLRYFEPNKTFSCLNYKGLKLGVTICEDIWYNENEFQYHTYDVDPADVLKNRGADLIINVSASPYTVSKHENRMGMLRNHARKLKLPVLYSNQVGSHTDVIFDGDTVAISSDAEVIATTEPFQASHTDIIWDENIRDIKPINDQTQHQYPQNRSERQFKAITCGLSEYFSKSGLEPNVVLGLSGGIDSAVVCVLAAEALGADRVTAITMPSRFSSEGSVADSGHLAENLGIELINLPIKKIYDTFNESLKPIFQDRPFGVAEENLQSRIRGTILMAYANKYSHFLLPTGNKSEYAVGYATLYGDMNGALSIIGDLYKHEVYELAVWLNEFHYRKEVIPEAIIQKEPSAELRPDQKDSDSLPDYGVLDDILYRYIELKQNAKKIIEDGFDRDIVYRIIRLVDFNEFKRYQAAPILKLSSKSFGLGRRWPMVQKWTGADEHRSPKNPI
tara:strand:- start:30804 stop:32510 length:1707 start_codon:yes stop_codon:yes gene_type:complete